MGLSLDLERGKSEILVARCVHSQFEDAAKSSKALAPTTYRAESREETQNSQSSLFPQSEARPEATRRPRRTTEEPRKEKEA